MTRRFTYAPMTFSVGALRCTVLADGDLTAPASFLFANAASGELAPLLAARGLDPAAIPAGLNCLLVEAGELRLLWDTGTGGRWHDGLGRLPAVLDNAGIDPRSIELVVLSHGHPDHLGGLLDPAGRPRFPRARYLISEIEWEHWTDEASLARLDPAWAEAARAVLPAIAERVEWVAGEREIFPGIRLIPSPGHTPGHLAMELASAGERLLAVGDAIGHPLHVERPDWRVATDADPVQSPITRRALLERAAGRGALVFANHFVFPGLGRVERDPGGYAWRELRAEIYALAVA